MSDDPTSSVKALKERVRGRGKSYEAETEAKASRPRPKIIMKKYQIMINNNI